MTIRTYPPDFKVAKGDLENIKGRTHEVLSVTLTESGMQKVVYVPSKKKLEPKGGHAIVVKW